MPRLRIGYIPNSSDMGHPADRRRIVYWAKNRGHEIVLDLNQKYDVLVLSGRADLTLFTKKRNTSPIILDLVDGYLGKEQLWRDWIRGIGKVVTNQNSGLLRPYREIVIDACQLAQAVVCETLEQKETITPYCKNTHNILDFHEEFPILPFNSNPRTTYSPALLWEGLPFTAKGLLQLKSTLTGTSKSHSISLEMVTDLEYPMFLGKYLYRPTQKLLENIPEILGEKFKLTNWSLQAVIEGASRAHIAVLPLDPTAPLNPLKAENRLLMMWRLGLPVIASPSMAYLRVMRDTQIDSISHTSDQWQAKILELIESIELRKESVEKGQQYIRETHSKEIVLRAWDNLFESVL
jgi:hypothetical protein